VHASDSATCASWTQSGATAAILSASARVCLAIDTLAASGGSIITTWMLIDLPLPGDAPMHRLASSDRAAHS
jgi:hypothetical protein